MRVSINCGVFTRFTRSSLPQSPMKNLRDLLVNAFSKHPPPPHAPRANFSTLPLPSRPVRNAHVKNSLANREASSQYILFLMHCHLSFIFAYQQFLKLKGLIITTRQTRGYDYTKKQRGNSSPFIFDLIQMSKCFPRHQYLRFLAASAFFLRFTLGFS